MVEVSRPGPGNRLLPLPKSNPPFTLGDLKRAIPPHCFKRSIPRSFAHLFRDIAIAFFFYYVATNYFHRLPHPLLYVAWPLYWLLQGCIFFAAWIVGHECGHHAFSDYQWLDDTVGFLVHSAVLTPYFSWKLSHRRHHFNTNSLEKDEAYVPNEKSENGSFSAKYLNNPPGRLFRVVIRLSLGWYLYVCFHVSGRKYDRFACHFDPYSPIYLESERALIMMSDAGLVAMGFALYHLATVKGFEWLLCVYGVPILVMYVVLVLVTYLHHTHIAIPHYNSSKWDWMRGSLATVDRDYGFLNVVFHNLTDTHVVHHLFSTMPHYHAVEATKAIKSILGEYYSYDGTPIIQALWRESKECIYVEPDKGDHKGIYWYSN